MTIEISENHRRRLSVTLTLLDEALHAYKQWAAGSEIHSVFLHEKNDLTTGQKTAIMHYGSEISRLLAELKDTFDLGQRVEEVSRMIIGRNAWLWSSIVELHPEYMRGYGALPRDAREYLTLKINELEGLMSVLSSVVSESK